MKCVICARKAVKLLALFSEGDWAVSLSDQKVVFENDDIVIIQRIEEYKFPDLMAVVPKEIPILATVNKKAFQTTIIKALICAPRINCDVLLDINSRLTLSSEDDMTNNAYTRQLSCQHTGPDIKVALNGRMLFNLIKNIKSEELVFGMKNADGAVTINGSTLVMPIKQCKY
jgi:DNA polymerase-3 subunit beta